jgi:hypothetical protein
MRIVACIHRFQSVEINHPLLNIGVYETVAIAGEWIAHRRDESADAFITAVNGQAALHIKAGIIQLSSRLPFDEHDAVTPLGGKTDEGNRSMGWGRKEQKVAEEQQKDSKTYRPVHFAFARP